MLGKLLARATAALLLLMAGAAAGSAQNYDGSGLLKFGVFGQGTFLSVDQNLPVVASADPSGFTGGVSVGYDLRLWRHWLLGIELDGSFGDARDRADLTDYGFDYLLTLRGRVGVYPLDHWLLYGTAGVGFLGTEHQRPGFGNKVTETLTGFVGGAGTEINVHHVILFGEYLYGDFGDREFTIANLRHEANIDAHIVRLGMKFKIGHDYAHDYTHPDHYRRYGGVK